MIIQNQEKKLPNLEVKVKQSNNISNLGYYSYEERVFDLANLLKSSLSKEYTSIIGSNTYVSREFEERFKQEDIIFNGVYKLGSIDNYMGFIPEENQQEIKEKFNSLVNNPFLKQQFKLLILAPLNNFATENNITAIDPIAFAYFKDGQHSSEKNCLITLSQWI